MLDPGTPNRKENEMNARPSRTHVFDTAPTLTFFLQLWKDYGEPARVEISHALHHHFLTSARSGDYRGWLDSLDSGAIAADEMLGDRALWLRSFVEVPRRKPTTFDAPTLAKQLADRELAKLVDAPVDRKSSDGKLAMNLVTSDLTRQAAAADTYGAEKYEEPGSWRNAPVEDVVRYVDAAERHLSDVKAFLVEGKKDRWLAEDSKLAHLAHLAATVGILIEFAQRMGLDLPEEFDRHWLRDPNDPRCERRRGAPIMNWSEPDAAP